MVEKAQLWDRRVQLEKVIFEVCEWVPEATKDEDIESKVQRLGMVIAQLEHDNNILNALIHLDTPPEQVADRKSTMEDMATHLEEIEQEAKKVTEATTQFWGSVVQDEKLAQLTKQL